MCSTPIGLKVGSLSFENKPTRATRKGVYCRNEEFPTLVGKISINKAPAWWRITHHSLWTRKLRYWYSEDFELSRSAGSEKHQISACRMYAPLFPCTRIPLRQVFGIDEIICHSVTLEQLPAMMEHRQEVAVFPFWD